jgi:hypothetical protein
MPGSDTLRQQTARYAKYSGESDCRTKRTIAD